MLNASNVYPFAYARSRHQHLKQTPFVLWFTGLSASGKSTIANQVDILLRSRGRFTYILDGDNIRSGICRDLGFSDRDRDENIRRVSEIAALMADAGLIVIVATISPSKVCRHHARSIIGNDRFVEVFADAPLNVVEARDPKGLYAKARQGLIKNFTGLSSDYEVPVCPEIHLKTDELSVTQAAQGVTEWLAENVCSELLVNAAGHAS